MGTVTVASLVAKAASILKDKGLVRWTEPEHIEALNTGQSLIAVHKPTASTKAVAVALIAGTRQAIPADGIQLVDIVRNLGIDGLTPGRAISITPRVMIDTCDPDWHSMRPGATVLHYLFDPQEPKGFYVYPPQPTTPTKVEMIYACTPALAIGGGTITVDDIYASVLLDYMLHAAYTKDGEYEGNILLADRHLKLFFAALIGKAKSEVASNPNNP